MPKNARESPRPKSRINQSTDFKISGFSTKLYQLLNEDLERECVEVCQSKLHFEISAGFPVDNDMGDDSRVPFDTSYGRERRPRTKHLPSLYVKSYDDWKHL